MPSTRSSPRNTISADRRVINGSIRKVWHKSAPRSVRRAFSSGDHLDGWNAWKTYLAARKHPTEPAKLLPGEGDPLGWALPDGLDPQFRPVWLRHARKLIEAGRPAEPSLERALLAWLAESAGAAADARYALEALAAGRTIAPLAGLLSPEVWWTLLDRLLATVADAQQIELHDDPLVHQLLAGELPLTLAYLLPEITPCRKLKSAARKALSSGPVDLLDGEGLPHGKHLALLRPLWACWTRCRAIGGELKGGCWSKSAGSQYEWLIRQALRLVRHDGSQVFSHGSAGSFDRELFAAALRLDGDDDDHDIATLVLPPQKKDAQRGVDEMALPKPAAHSEWASVAVLRPRWLRSGERLTVAYHQPQPQIELGCGKDLLLSGAWELQLHVDGRPAQPESEWEQLCWVSDDDVDFLEIELQLSGGVRVQRQMLLAREDRVLLLADAILGTESRKFEYRACLPLYPGISFQGSPQSREGLLVGSKRRALVLPLALPEWLADRRGGRLVQTEKGLEFCQSAHGRRFYAPLFIDLDRRRMTARRTWRKLTVAETLEIQPDEVAAGYRVALGKQQWLIYRSLAENANRTLLGHNLSNEMLFARFLRCGEVEPLLEIE